MKPIKLSSHNWLKLIMFIGLYFYAVRSASKATEQEFSFFDNYIVCQDDKDKVWCTSTSALANQNLMQCINACPDAEAWLHPLDETVLGVEPYGALPLSHTCFLKCFFAMDIAIYRKVPAKQSHLFSFLENSVLCFADEDQAYCHVLNQQDEKEKKRFSQFIECLENTDFDLVLPRKHLSVLITTKGLIRENKLFQQCFFNDKTAIALRKSTKNNLLSFLERDKVPGYEIGPLHQLKRGAM